MLSNIQGNFKNNIPSFGNTPKNDPEWAVTDWGMPPEKPAVKPASKNNDANWTILDGGMPPERKEKSKLDVSA